MAKKKRKKFFKKKAPKSDALNTQQISTSEVKKEAAKQELQINDVRMQKLQSVILFAASILFILIVFIQGSSGWYALHKFFRGTFGISVLIMPLILFLSVRHLEKQDDDDFIKIIWRILALALLVSSFVQIMFIGDINKTDLMESIKSFYKEGIENTFGSGGAISVFLSYPMIRIFGETGARILITLLLFIVIMWVLNWNIRELGQHIIIPFKKLKNWLCAGSGEDEEDEEYDEDDYIENDSEQSERKPYPRFIQKAYDLLNDFFFFNEEDDEIDEEESIDNNTVSKNRKQSNKKVNKSNQSEPEIEYSENYSEDESNIIRNQKPQDTSDWESMIHSVTSSPSMQETGNIDVDLPDAGIPSPVPVANPEKIKSKPKRSTKYKIPSLEFLKPGISRANDANTRQELSENAATLVDTLKSFGVVVRITGIYRGPSVTRYEVQPAAGVKVSKITGLADDIALSLAAEGVRIEAPIPGKAAVGIEVPNQIKDVVSLREILESDVFRKSKSKLSFAVGKDIAGNAIVGDIAKMPHMIIAGSTGSGKSVCTNSIIMSILFHAAPDEVKLILIDPKIVEFRVYEGIPHLLIPVVTDPKKAAGALNWAVQEMLRRYKLFADTGVRDIYDYNSKVKELPNLPDSEEPLVKMPQIVIAIDELADLMMAASKEVEDSICRLAQMARAAGMHLIIATQRPTTDIITGLIKANIPSRIALSVMSQVDSRTILDTGGAEKLLGHGDMLYFPNGMPKPVRVQGCFTSTKEIESVISFIKEQSQGSYDNSIIEQVENSIPVTKSDRSSSSDSSDANSDEALIELAMEVVVQMGQASTSALQRRLKLGYARAARIMDELEKIGVIGPYEGAKPRRVFMSSQQLEERKMRNMKK